MKKLIYTLAIFLFCFKTYSQCNYTNSINVSTGIDNNGNVLPIGVVDPNWQLMNNAPLRTQCSANYTPFVFPSQAWTTNHDISGPNDWANLAGTRALGPADPAITSSAGGDNFNCSNANASQPFVYDRLFCLDTSASVTFDLEFKGDDYCTLALIDPNGNIIQNAPGGGNHQGTTGIWNNTYNLTTVGTYRLRAYSRNTAHHSIGFSVRGSISSTNNVLSNSSPQCCRDYAITIQKILDNNCDGIYNAGDLNGTANWVFDILPLGSNTPVFTGSTNNNGEIIVTGLVSGTYIVREQSNTLSSYNIPLNNNLQVTIGDNNLVGMVNFYNCQPNHLKIRKILDNDCDGVYGKLDQVGSAGWTFDVYNGNNLIGTATTNSLGIATISGLPSGNYTIVEQPNTGSAYPNPFQNSISITYDSTVIQRVDFFNCPSKLNIRKVLDDNCDGVFNGNDQIGGTGWTFDIYSGTNVVATATTNNSGIATITGLPSGNYSVVEQINSGNPFPSPYQANIQFTYDATISQTIDYFNCRNSKLYIRKILDEDCDGVFGASDQIGGSGWTFKLYSGTTIFATATTNNSGIATFRGLPSGNYSIIEQPNLTSSYPSPFQINISTIFDESIFQTVDFFNCPPQPFPECCENPLTFKKPTLGQIVNAPNGYNGSEPFSMVTQQFEITNPSVIPITEFRAVVTDIDFNYDLEACAECIDNPALWGSIGGSLYVGNKLTNNDQSNILNDRINRREVIWRNPKGAMLISGDTFSIDYALPPLSEIPCCVTSINICLEISYKDANCQVCTYPVCTTIELSETSQEVSELSIEVKKKGCCERTLTANSDVFANYQWSTGETTQQINVTQNGTYSVTATGGGTSITKTIIVGDIMTGAFPLLSFNSLFHPDFVPPYKNKFYIMDVSPGKTIQGVPNSYNANEYKLEIWHRWNTQGGQGNPLKTITGISDTCTGFNNWDIYWDGTEQSGASLKDEKADSYIWRLTLKNCNNESSKLTYKTNWIPVCNEYRYLFPRRKWVRLGCKNWGGYWNTETFEFGDVQMTK